MQFNSVRKLSWMTAEVFGRKKYRKVFWFFGKTWNPMGLDGFESWVFVFLENLNF